MRERALCSSSNVLGLLGTLCLSSCNADDMGPSLPPGKPAGGEMPGADAGQIMEMGDPCAGVSSTGRCSSSRRIEVCVSRSGTTPARSLRSYDCKDGETCDDTQGAARCTRTVECTSGFTSCKDAHKLRTCVAGAWTEAVCSGRCVKSPLGASCAPDLATQTVTGVLQYEARLPNLERTGWTDVPSTFPARYVAVLSFAGQALIDATTTDENGAFSLLGAANRTGADRLAVVAAGVDAAGTLAFAVVNPGYPSAERVLREPFSPAPDPAVWSFSFALETWQSGQVITVAESSGSAALHVFDMVREVFTRSESTFAPKTTETLLVWLSPGTTWTCGACMLPVPVDFGGQTFRHQIALDGSDEDQGYWSDAVSAHELGHYVMSAFGYPSAESGPHIAGEFTNPGLAWAEGFATFYSTFVRDSTLYYDQQESAFFWFDLATRAYAEPQETPWVRPIASAGLKQLIDENEVAAMLHNISTAIGATPLLTALSSDRMRVSPFERGYTARAWFNPYDPSNFTDTGVSTPYLADFFDALRCSEAIRARDLDRITEPNVRYPYPSTSPLCR